MHFHNSTQQIQQTQITYGMTYKYIHTYIHADDACIQHINVSGAPQLEQLCDLPGAMNLIADLPSKGKHNAIKRKTRLLRVTPI